MADHSREDYESYWELRKGVEQIIEDIEAAVSFGDELDAEELLAKLEKLI